MYKRLTLPSNNLSFGRIAKPRFCLRRVFTITIERSGHKAVLHVNTVELEIVLNGWDQMYLINIFSRTF